MTRFSHKGLALLLLIVGASYYTLAAEPEKAPNFSLESTEGATYSLSDFQGKIVIVTFFKKTCVPCKMEVPLLNRMAKEYPNQLRVLGVGYMTKSTKQLKKTAKKWNIEYPVLVDSKGALSRRFLVSAPPHSVLIDEYGYVIKHYLGFRPEELERDIKAETERLKAKKRTISCLPLINSTEAAKKENLGKTIADIIATKLKKKGLKVVGHNQSSEFVIEGSVSKIGSVIGISVIIKQKRNGAVLAEISRSVEENDFSSVADEIFEKISALL